MTRYPDDPIRPVVQIAMPRAPQIYAPGGLRIWSLDEESGRIRQMGRISDDEKRIN